MMSKVIILTWPRGGASSSACASAGLVTFIRNTAPDPSLLANHWSILPACCRRIVVVNVASLYREFGATQSLDVLQLFGEMGRLRGGLKARAAPRGHAAGPQHAH
jgi:hypothetical protein